MDDGDYVRRSLDRAPAIRSSLLVARTTIDPSASIDVEGRTLGHSGNLETGNTELEGRHLFLQLPFFLQLETIFSAIFHFDRSIFSATQDRKIDRNLLPFVPFSFTLSSKEACFICEIILRGSINDGVPSARDFLFHKRKGSPLPPIEHHRSTRPALGRPFDESRLYYSCYVYSGMGGKGGGSRRGRRATRWLPILFLS